MKIVTINASDDTVGGAAGVAVGLHSHFYSKNEKSRMFVGKKKGNNHSIEEIKRPWYTKYFSYILSNDIDFFKTNYLLTHQDLINADVVHVHNINGWYFNLRTLIEISKIKPTIWTLHDMWSLTPHCGYSDSNTLRNGLYICSDKRLYPTTLWNNQFYLSARKKYLYKNAKFHIVTPSKWLENKVMGTCLSNNFCQVIHNGIDTKIFRPKDKYSIKLALGLRKKRIILLIAADVENNIYKGFSDYEWIANNCPLSDTEFIAIGARENGWKGRVKLIKSTADKNILADYLAAADVLVLPSRIEMFPLVLLESLSSGTPVIAYDVGGVRECITNLPNCMTINPGDKHELLSSLISFYENFTVDNQSISGFLHQFIIKKFSHTIMNSKYEKLYFEVIKNFRD